MPHPPPKLTLESLRLRVAAKRAESAQFAADEPRRRPVARTVHGIKVMVENAKGTIRSGTDRRGKRWQSQMSADYGYVSRAKGQDGEALDIFVGDTPSPDVHICHTQDPYSRVYDEDKAVVNGGNQEQAKALFLSHYDSPAHLRSITTMPLSRFKSMLSGGEIGGARWSRKARRAPETRAIFSTGTVNFNDDEDRAGAHWITVGSDKSAPPGHKGGSHVEIDKGGKILKGAPGLKGHNVGSLPKSSGRSSLNTPNMQRVRGSLSALNEGGATPDPRRVADLRNPKHPLHDLHIGSVVGSESGQQPEHGGRQPHEVSADQYVDAALLTGHAKDPEEALAQHEQHVAQAINRGEDVPDEAVAAHEHLQGPAMMGAHHADVAAREQAERDAATPDAAEQFPTPIQSETEEAIWGNGGKLEGIPVGPDGQVSPDLQDAYHRAAHQMGYEVGPWQADPQTGTASAEVRRKGEAQAPATPEVPQAVAQPSAVPAVPQSTGEPAPSASVPDEPPAHLAGEPAEPAPWTLTPDEYKAKALKAKQFRNASQAYGDHARHVAEAMERGDEVPEHVADYYPHLTPGAAGRDAMGEGGLRRAAGRVNGERAEAEDAGDESRGQELDDRLGALMTDEEAGAEDPKGEERPPEPQRKAVPPEAPAESPASRPAGSVNGPAPAPAQPAAQQAQPVPAGAPQPQKSTPVAQKPAQAQPPARPYTNEQLHERVKAVKQANPGLDTALAVARAKKQLEAGEPAKAPPAAQAEPAEAKPSSPAPEPKAPYKPVQRQQKATPKPATPSTPERTAFIHDRVTRMRGEGLPTDRAVAKANAEWDAKRHLEEATKPAEPAESQAPESTPAPAEAPPAPEVDPEPQQSAPDPDDHEAMAAFHGDQASRAIDRSDYEAAKHHKSEMERHEAAAYGTPDAPGGASDDSPKEADAPAGAAAAFGSPEHRKQEREFKKSLTPDEKEAFKFWGGQGSWAIRDLLRKAEDPTHRMAFAYGEQKEKAQKHLATIREALRRAPRVSTEAWRGLESVPPEKAAKFVPGAVIPVNDLESFTNSKAVAGRFSKQKITSEDHPHVIYHVTGDRFVDIHNLTGAKEAEVIPGENRNYRVKSVREEMNKYGGGRMGKTLHVEMEPAGASDPQDAAGGGATPDSAATGSPPEASPATPQTEAPQEAPATAAKTKMTLADLANKLRNPGGSAAGPRTEPVARNAARRQIEAAEKRGDTRDADFHRRKLAHLEAGKTIGDAQDAARREMKAPAPAPQEAPAPVASGENPAEAPDLTDEQLRRSENRGRERAAAGKMGEVLPKPKPKGASVAAARREAEALGVGRKPAPPKTISAPEPTPAEPTPANAPAGYPPKPLPEPDAPQDGNDRRRKPHQMTAKVYADDQQWRQDRERADALNDGRAEVASRIGKRMEEARRGILDAHRRHVAGALSRGEGVHPKVLADYPDLARPATEPQSAVPPPQPATPEGVLSPESAASGGWGGKAGPLDHVTLGESDAPDGPKDLAGRMQGLHGHEYAVAKRTDGKYVVVSRKQGAEPIPHAPEAPEQAEQAENPDRPDAELERREAGKTAADLDAAHKAAVEKVRARHAGQSEPPAAPTVSPEERHSARQNIDTVRGNREDVARRLSATTDPDRRAALEARLKQFDARISAAESPHPPIDFATAKYDPEVNADFARRHKLAPAEASAVRGYSSMSYQSVNKRLRGQPVANPGATDYKIQDIVSGLNKLPDRPGTTYRGVQFSTPAERDAALSRYEPGGTVTEPTVLSTTKTTGRQKDFVNPLPGGKSIAFTVRGKSGKDIAPLNAIPEDDEVLFKPGTPFKVHSVTHDGDVAHVELEEAGAKSAKSAGGATPPAAAPAPPPKQTASTPAPSPPPVPRPSEPVTPEAAEAMAARLKANPASPWEGSGADRLRDMASRLRSPRQPDPRAVSEMLHHYGRDSHQDSELGRSIDGMGRQLLDRVPPGQGRALLDDHESEIRNGELENIPPAVRDYLAKHFGGEKVEAKVGGEWGEHPVRDLLGGGKNEAPAPPPGTAPAPRHPLEKPAAKPRNDPRGALRRQIVEAYKAQGGGVPDDVHQFADSLPNAFTFHRNGPYAGEVRQHVGKEGGKEGVGVAARGAVRLTDEKQKSGGEDAVNAFRERYGKNGEDLYWRMVRERSGTEGKDALEHARKSSDPKLRFLAAVHDTLPSRAKGRAPQEQVPTDRLRMDDRFEVNGVPVRVTMNEDGEWVIADHGAIPETPVQDLPPTLSIDKGTKRNEEPADTGDDFGPAEGVGEEPDRSHEVEQDLAEPTEARAEEPAAPAVEPSKSPEPPPTPIEALKAKMAEKAAEKVPAPESNPTVDTSRQLGIFAKDAAGNPAEVGERPGQVNLFNPSKYDKGPPPKAAPPPKDEPGQMVMPGATEAAKVPEPVEPPATSPSMGHVDPATAVVTPPGPAHQLTADEYLAARSAQREAMAKRLGKPAPAADPAAAAAEHRRAILSAAERGEQIPARVLDGLDPDFVHTIRSRFNGAPRDYTHPSEAADHARRQESLSRVAEEGRAHDEARRQEAEAKKESGRAADLKNEYYRSPHYHAVHSAATAAVDAPKAIERILEDPRGYGRRQAMLGSYDTAAKSIERIKRGVESAPEDLRKAAAAVPDYLKEPMRAHLKELGVPEPVEPAPAEEAPAPAAPATPVEALKRKMASKKPADEKEESVKKHKYYIKHEGKVVGYLKHSPNTQKGPRWILNLSDPKDPSRDKIFRYRNFDEAYAAAYKKKPGGSHVERHEGGPPRPQFSARESRESRRAGDLAAIKELMRRSREARGIVFAHSR